MDVIENGSPVFANPASGLGQRDAGVSHAGYSTQPGKKVQHQISSSYNVASGGLKMKIGLDLDGTVYSYPAFFADMIRGMVPLGHVFFSISSHGRSEWDTTDVPRLLAMGVPAELIDPSLMHQERHGDLKIKGLAADKCDLVFDDDKRLQSFTQTPVFAPLSLDKSWKKGMR